MQELNTTSSSKLAQAKQAKGVHPQWTQIWAGKEPISLSLTATIHCSLAKKQIVHSLPLDARALHAEAMCSRNRHQQATSNTGHSHAWHRCETHDDRSQKIQIMRLVLRGRTYRSYPFASEACRFGPIGPNHSLMFFKFLKTTRMLLSALYL